MKEKEKEKRCHRHRHRLLIENLEAIVTLGQEKKKRQKYVGDIKERKKKKRTRTVNNDDEYGTKTGASTYIT